MIVILFAITYFNNLPKTLALYQLWSLKFQDVEFPEEVFGQQPDFIADRRSPLYRQIEHKQRLKRHSGNIVKQ